MIHLTLHTMSWLESIVPSLGPMNTFMCTCIIIHIITHTHSHSYIHTHTHTQLTHTQGAAGYLEAVKATQLEEVIDQQKQEIEFLKDQINQLTGTGITEEKGDSSLGQLSSLPTNVSDSGPLKRQVIQLQRAMKVGTCIMLCQTREREE